MFDPRTFASTFFLCSCLLFVVACGGDKASTSTGTEATDASLAQTAAKSRFDGATIAFFEDLPDAKDVPQAEMGDLYFKLLTRITVKAQAVRNEKAARSTRDLIDYAHAQAIILETRSESLPEEEKSKLFQDSLSQIMWAERKYQMALRKFGDDDPKYLRDFAEYADKDWPQLR